MHRRTVVMGTATSQNGVNGPLPTDRPKVYPCADCGNENEFTKLALVAHKRKCLHQVLCTCIVCSFKPPVKQYKKSSKPCSFSHVSFKVTNLSKTHGIVGTGNSVKVSEMIKKIQSALADQPRIESSKSSKNSHSGCSHSNQIQELHHVTSVSAVVSESKCTKRKSAENSDSGANNPDHEPCDRKIYCIICKMHIFWESFGTHVLQHSIKTENSHLVCSVCSQSCLLPNHYLMHFFGHTSDHDCQECHCSNDKCPCYAQISTICCYICLKSFADLYAVIPHMMIHT
ncbi:hypothetical protein AVEN_237766-1 [Araneus ventricosus]|uniref:C2H2-type domain-containing protein n=1 Tax=Araneus ventricosus TaxID=182803 RepID=A0A4Y2QQT9_ARAVE|nr:hypothetical protein AVEN_8082-1 [Araneus ventricosus]GBN65747.1 hypothetical protein AVEN_237766-1 [Araneus ventricosus]